MFVSIKKKKITTEGLCFKYEVATKPQYILYCIYFSMIREELRFSNGHSIRTLRRDCPNRILTEARNEIIVPFKLPLESKNIIFRKPKEMKSTEAKHRSFFFNFVQPQCPQRHPGHPGNIRRVITAARLVNGYRD